MTSRLDDLMLSQIRDGKFPEPKREHRFHPDRKWRFDFAWPGHRLALELEGGTWTKGRHTRAKGYQGDCQKYNAAAVAGWLVLRFTGEMIRSGEAIKLLDMAFDAMTNGGDK